MSETCDRPGERCSMMRIVSGLGVIAFVIATLATLDGRSEPVALAVLALTFAVLYGICCVTDAISEAVIQLRVRPRLQGSDTSET